MFDRVVLPTNIGRTKEMVCTPKLIWDQQGTAVYNRRVMGEGGIFRQQKKTRGICKDYRGGDVRFLSLSPHE